MIKSNVSSIKQYRLNYKAVRISFFSLPIIALVILIISPLAEAQQRDETIVLAYASNYLNGKSIYDKLLTSKQRKRQRLIEKAKRWRQQRDFAPAICIDSGWSCRYSEKTGWILESKRN